MSETSSDTSTVPTMEMPAPAPMVQSVGNVTTKGKPIIPAGSVGGTLSIDSYFKTLGQESPKDEPDADFELTEAEQDAVVEEEKKEEPSEEVKEADEEEKVEAKDDEDSEEEDKDDDTEDDTKSQTKGKSFKAKTAAGKEIEIPEDAVIYHTVDGELQEIPLKEHLNIVAGELTVNQRLGKVASFKEEVDKRLADGIQRETEFNNKFKNLVDLAKQGKNDAAFCYLAEISGNSPVQMYKSILAEAVKASAAFEGMTPEQIENHFYKMELDYRDQSAKKRAEEEGRTQSRSAWEQRVDAEIKEQGLTEDEFIEAVSTLKTNLPSWKDLDAEQRKDTAIQQAFYVRHISLVADAIKGVNPDLAKDKKLVEQILKTTNPKEWTVGEVQALLKEVLGQKTKQIASSLSRKVTPSEVQKSQKQNGAKQEKKTFRTLSEMQNYYGLSSR